MFRKMRKRFGRWWQSRHASKCFFTWEEALEIARKYHLENEIKVASIRGMGLFPIRKSNGWNVEKNKPNNSMIGNY